MKKPKKIKPKPKKKTAPKKNKKGYNKYDIDNIARNGY